MGEQTIPNGHGSLHVRWWGSAESVETVVLLHGGPGMTARYMESILEEFLGA